MIRRIPVAEPSNFDVTVRQPGLESIRELVGEPRVTPRPGPRLKKTWPGRSAIPPASFPDLWTRALPALRAAFDDCCGYLAMYINEGTGNATVDHFVPKQPRWDLVYEWSNYRLAAGSFNALKGTSAVVDPFEVQPGWFELEFVGFQVKPGREVPAERLGLVAGTCDLLNAPRFCRERERYVEMYERGELRVEALHRLAPFIASELRRQGRFLSAASGDH